MTNEEAIKNLSLVKQIDDMLGDLDGGVKTSDLSKALAMAIEALQQQPCDDCISREMLLKRLNSEEENFRADHMETIETGDDDPFVDGVLSGVFNFREMVIQAPSVYPNPKTGHWEFVEYDQRTIGNWHCSECRFIARYSLNKDDRGGVAWFNYCPVCGAKMESEDKE